MYNKVIHRKHRLKKYIFFIAVIFFVGLSSWYLYQSYYPLFSTRVDYSPLIKDAAQRYEIDPCLLKAVIWQESRFRPNIKGKHNEIGLMQIRPEYGAASDWAAEKNIELPCEGVLYQPELNIEIGAWYLGRALKRWSAYKYQYELALSEYNAGLKGMKPWVPDTLEGEVVERITIPSTKAYIKSIMAKYQEYASRRQAE